MIDNNFKTSNYSNSQYKGKNLIIIQVESLQQFVINRKYNGKEITPNLNKLISQSLYFDNCYYQISLGHTSDAELLTNTSLYPLENSSVYMTKYNNEFEALPKVMDSMEYNTFAVHGNKASFWNRNSVYNKYGFNKFYSVEKLKNDDMIDMGLSDKSLFNQNVDIIKKNKKPFYDFTITLTSHSPFKVNNDFCNPDILH
ncbi:phosphoglycerol transferase MdoB-like AlkP superfamily enzyme [Clostridium algifaecis]|uniref:Phosphoglycerol transferase MdoB-like AlkP superfamily enzyme n=1 Tax=Clostridium algifaecis TaxID=1472040 RepID=A0ABS4KRI2_9CLOT|nr:sulfatase-like hydrolase/transferase [Clostridium algifaecis]MBP2032210.1 phosphoglycerol transferase MdoB-like AlkP superfamily enzyme [Clostridium algifaecis]